jgi:hypothetical protein
MFHPSRLLEVQSRIFDDLKQIDLYGSVKLYLCWYDEYLVAEKDYNGNYPCSEKSVSLFEILAIIRVVFKRPHIVRHNVLIGQMPVAKTTDAEDQEETEKYVEVCLVY